MNIEVAIPCYNEAITIQKVIRDFRAELPEAEVVVYDNNSQDNSAELAIEAGARVVPVNQQGKGYVLRDIFETSKADIVILVDGDDTYESRDVRDLIEPIIKKTADMTIGTRLHSNPQEFRKMHHLGNRFLTWLLNITFRTSFQDILSGYRAFNRCFIENVPLLSAGFEVETELMIQALENDMTVCEIPIHYRGRPTGSYSKLNTFGDGYRIILMIVTLLRDHKPLFVFSFSGLFLMLVGLPIWTIGFFYGKPDNMYSVFRSVGAIFILSSFGLFLVGLILNTINVRLLELRSLLRRKHI